MAIAPPAPQVQDGGVKRIAVVLLLLAVIDVAACARRPRTGCYARPPSPPVSDATALAPAPRAEVAAGVRTEDTSPAPIPTTPVPGTTQPVAPPKEPRRPVLSVPEPPFAWLAPYAQKTTTAATFARLRERLFRMEKDADLIRGCSWLVHALSPDVRTAAGRILADAYLLGDHLGADPMPALRALAADPDQDVRSYTLSALGFHDSPLAREVYLRHHTGEIPIPAGKAGAKIRREIKQNLPKYASEIERKRLAKADKRVRQIWYDLAEDLPATKTKHRWETGDLRIGRSNGAFLTSLPGWEIWAGPVSTTQNAPGRTASGDLVMLWLIGKQGPNSGTGGPYPYFGGMFGDAKLGSTIYHARYLGKDRVRYWVRFDPSGRAMKHHFRKP